MNWEIFTYGNGEFLRVLFNGIAAIMGHGGYGNLLQLTGYVALTWIALSSALTLRPLDFKWLITFIFVYNILFVPKVEVIITDRIDPSQSSVVGNVPWGLGVFASISSQIGDTLTTWSEAVNTLPNDLKYQRNGVVMASSLVEAASQFEITDADMQANMSSFFLQCVFYDILLRRYTWNQLLSESDLWTFLSTNASAARSFEYDGSIVTCQVGAALLNNDWALEIQRASRIYGKRFNESLTMVNAQAKLLSDLPLSYDYLAGISRTGADLIRQNMMINLFKRSLTRHAASADATAAAQDFAIAQAEAQKRTAYATVGKLAAKLIPIFKNIFEGLLYGAFPFLFLFFLLPIGGRAILMYLQNLAWLQFWAPLFSILNLLMTLYGNMSSSAYVADAGNNAVLTLQTASGLAQVNSDTAIMAGYMSMSIPLIAYGLVTGGRIALTQLAAQVGAVAQRYALQSSSDASTGNMSLANMGAYNTSMFKHDTTPTHKTGEAQYTDASTGVSYTMNRTGTFASVPSNQLPVSSAVESAVRSGISYQTAQKVESAAASMAAYADSANQTYTQLHQFADSLDKTRSTSIEWSSGTVESYKKEAGEVAQLVESFKTNHDLSSQQKAGLLTLASASMEFPGVVKLVSPVDLEGKLGLQLESAAAYKEVWSEALDYAKRTNFGEQYEQAINAGHRAIASGGMGSNDRYTEQVSDQLHRDQNLRDQVTATLSEASSWQRANSFAMDDAFRFSLDLAPAIRQYMIDQDVLGGTQGVDAIFARAANGYAQDQDIIARYAQNFAQERGLELADIDKSSTDGENGIRESGQEQIEHVRETGVNAAVDLVTNAKSAAEPSNISDQMQFDEGFTRILQQSETLSSQISNQVQNNKLTDDGLENEVKEQLEEAKSTSGLIIEAGSGVARSAAESPRQLIDALKSAFSDEPGDKK